MKIVGIDVSKDKLQYNVKVRCQDEFRWKTVHSGHVANSPSGFVKLLEKTRTANDMTSRFVMEATGVYHEKLCDYLHENGYEVYVELPNRIKNFARYINVKTKTDKIDAEIIARYGTATPDMHRWEPASPQLADMRDLSREIMALSDLLVRLKNQLHALQTASKTMPRVLASHKSIIKKIETEKEKLSGILMDLAHKDPDFSSRAKAVATIPGVTEKTAVQLACETNGFRNFHSIKQLVSYAGMDVVEYQSGTIEKKKRISKRGNRKIRKLIYMPGLVASRWNDNVKDLYERIVAKNKNVKKKGVIAAARKMLVLVYTIWKSNSTYDNCRNKKEVDKKPTSLDKTA